MNSTKFFFEATDYLMTRLGQLSRTTECCLREAEDMLCRKHEYPPGTDLLAGFHLWDLPVIAKEIEEVMSAFDMLCEASGRERRFELALEVLDAPDVVQWKLEQLLDRLRQELPQRPSA